jgi:hypothetical protein
MGMAKASKKYKFNKSQLKWLAALESGEYAQSKDMLCDGNGFCCLGVACDVLGAKFQAPQNGSKAYRFGPQLNVTFLPNSIRARLKLNSEEGHIVGDRDYSVGKVKFCGSLAEANDLGVKHKTIARFIRHHPEAVFTDA